MIDDRVAITLDIRSEQPCTVGISFKVLCLFFISVGNDLIVKIDHFHGDAVLIINHRFHFCQMDR